jgi:hypothetical protein
MLNIHELANVAIEGEHAISIYVCVDPSRRGDPRTPVAALRSLLDEAERKLTERGLSRRAIEPLLAEARSILNEDDIVNRQNPGLALFLAPGQFRRLQLPIPVHDQACVGPRFFIKPLLPLLEGDGPFYVLAATAGDARLWHGSRFSFKDVTPAGMPRSMAAVIAESEAPEELRDEARKTQLAEHLRRLAAAVAERLRGETAPLVLAAEPEVAGQLRKLLRLDQLQEMRVDINPFAVTPNELHDQVYAMLRPRFERELHQTEDRIRARLGTAEANVAIRLEEIVSHARFGRVDSLLVAENEVLWGHFDEASNTVLAHGSPAPGDEDLLNYAALMTLSNGGTVHTLARDRLPRQSLAAAALRY